MEFWNCFVEKSVKNKKPKWTLQICFQNFLTTLVIQALVILKEKKITSLIRRKTCFIKIQSGRHHLQHQDLHQTTWALSQRSSMTHLKWAPKKKVGLTWTQISFLLIGKITNNFIPNHPVAKLNPAPFLVFNPSTTSTRDAMKSCQYQSVQKTISFRAKTIVILVFNIKKRTFP